MATLPTVTRTTSQTGSGVTLKIYTLQILRTYRDGRRCEDLFSHTPTILNSTMQAAMCSLAFLTHSVCGTCNQMHVYVDTCPDMPLNMSSDACPAMPLANINGSAATRPEP
jgi:hypothetical protein